MPTQITVITPSDLADYYTAGEVDALLKSRDDRMTAIESRVAALETTPTPVPVPVPVPPPPETDDPVYPGQIVPMPPLAAGGSLVMSGQRYRLSAGLPTGVRISGQGEIIIPDGIAWSMQGTTLAGITLTGMKPRQQLRRVRDGLSAEFGGDRVTITLTQPQQAVTSAFIALDPRKRYGVLIEDGFVRGDGASPMQFIRCDASGREIGVWNPQTPTADQWNALRDCSGLKVRLVASRPSGLAGPLAPVFDVTKITLFEAVNDLATLGISPLENQSSIYIGSGTTLTDVHIRDMRLSAAKVVNASGAALTRVKVRHGIGGLSSQSSQGTQFIDCDVDLHALDEAGNRVPSGIIYRNHGINIALEAGCVVRGGRTVGSSWAIENAENSRLSTDTVIEGVTAEGVHNAISNNAIRGKTLNNKLRTSPLGYIGIESNLDDSVVQGNEVTQDCAAMQSHAVACATALNRVKILGNDLSGGIGVQFYAASPAPDRQITVDGNTIRYSVTAVAWNVQGVRVTNNKGGRTGYYAMRGTEAPRSLIQLGAAPLAANSGNTFSPP